MNHTGFLSVLDAEPVPGDADLGDMGLLLLHVAQRWRQGDEPALVRAAAAKALSSLQAAPRDDASVALEAAFVALKEPPAASCPAFVDGALQYAEVLLRHARWEAARDMCDFILALGRRTPAPMAGRVHWRRAYAHRALGLLDEALADYTAAYRAARRLGDTALMLRARLGFTKVIRSRGNLPAAETAIRAVLRRAVRTPDHDLIARIRHDLAGLLMERGKIREGLAEFRRTLAIPDYRARDFLLADSARALAYAGHVEPAHQLCEALVRHSKSTPAAGAARMSLLMIAGWERNAPEVERLAGLIQEAGVMPAMEVDFLLELGRARAAIGQAELARKAFALAADIAQRRRYGQLLIDADVELERLSAPRAAASGDDFERDALEATSFVQVAERALSGVA